MSPNQNKIWFPAKKYGWGWGFPNTWQGCVALAIWMILFFGGLYLIIQYVVSGLWWAVLYFFFMIIVLFVMCLLKGEPPRWRWGDKND